MAPSCCNGSSAGSAPCEASTDERGLEMNESQTRPRRSLVVVVLDAVLRLVAAVHAGGTPTPKVREAGGRRGVGRYLLFTGVLAALAGTALLVVVLVRAPGGPTPPPDRAAALPGLRPTPAEPSTTTAPGPAPTTPAGTATTPPAGTTTPTRATSSPVPATGSSKAPSISAPGAGVAQAPLTGSYQTSSVTAGLLGYRMTVTVANPGTTAKDGWTLTVTLPRSTLRVTDVDGATATQDGPVWSFTPDATTARVPAEESVEVEFEVHGATLINARPQDCRVDGNVCASAAR